MMLCVKENMLWTLDKRQSPRLPVTPRHPLGLLLARQHATGPCMPHVAQKCNSSTANRDVTVCKDELSPHVQLSNVCVDCGAELSSTPSVLIKQTPLEPRRAQAALPSCPRPGPAPGQPGLPGPQCLGQSGP